MSSRSSSASFVRDWLLSTDAVSLVALGFLRYFARMSSVLSTNEIIIINFDYFVCQLLDAIKLDR